MFKIGYINDNINELYDLNNIYIHDMYELIIEISKKYNLNMEFELIKDYTKEECDLVIYNLLSVNIDKMYWHEYFNQAKGNPKWFFFDTGEPHHIGLTQPTYIDNEYGTQWGDDRILRTLCYYKHPYKGYSVSTYEDTPTNFQYTPFIKWGFVDVLREYFNSTELEKQRNIKKKFFGSMVSSVTTPERYNFFNYITNNYKYIWSYGKTRNNTGNRFYTDERLYKLMPKFKFNICFENTRSDFNECYVTEKIFNAFKWGTVPIYWGENNYIYEFLNKDSFINLTGLSLKESLEIIKEYDNNDKLYYDMLYTNPINDSYNLTVLQKKYELFIVKMLTD